jgi:hypothetical protein
MTLELEQVRVHKPYTTETVHTALLALAATGNGEAASELVGVPRRTIIEWRKQYPNLYQHLAVRHSSEIEKHVATQLRATLSNAVSAANEAVDTELARIRAGDVKDTAASARSLMTAAGIAGTKLMELEGRPTTIVEHRSGAEALRQLAAQGLIIDTTAEETEPPHQAVSA